jgi:hypothetical protein
MTMLVHVGSNMADARAMYREGVNAIRDEKELGRGRKLLIESLRLDAENDMAWLWLSKTVNDKTKRIECIERALEINPGNVQAQQLKEQLLNVGFSSGSVSKSRDYSNTLTPRSQQVSQDVSQLGQMLVGVGMRKMQLFHKFTGIAAFLFLAFIFFMAFRTTPPRDSAALIFGGTALLSLMGVIGFLYSIVMAFGARMEVYEKGISRVIAGERKNWRWEDFSDMKIHERSMVYRYYGIPIYKLHQYDLFLMSNGKTLLKINKDFQKFREIGHLATQHVAPLIFERHQSALKRGETLKYGKIEVDRTHVQQGRKSADWNDIRNWKLEDGSLTLQRYSDNKKVNFSVSNIPNAHILVMLVDQKVGR